MMNEALEIIEINLDIVKKEVERMKKRIEELETENSELNDDVERSYNALWQVKAYIESELKAKGKKIRYYENIGNKLVPMIEVEGKTIPFYFSKDKERDVNDKNNR